MPKTTSPISDKIEDFTETINSFIKKRDESHRYTSFDFCYTYFKDQNGDFLNIT